MQSTLTELFTDLQIGDEFLCEPIRLVRPGAWSGHLMTAFWLTKIVQPEIFVELGTHSGNSYSAFCQAISFFELPARAFAVDTWQGDEHAGFYDESVHRDLDAFNAAHYAAFSKLLRTTFDEARSYFNDGTIDLLHIDGLHSYEAVKHDFDTWKSALSDRGVVVFHDTNVRERDFGVWRLWLELAEKYPSFEFHHSEGLGVLGVGPNQPKALRQLFELKNDPETAGTLRRIFAARGELFRSRAQVLDLSDHCNGLETELKTRRNHISVLEQQYVDLDRVLKEHTQALSSKDEVVRSLERQVASRDAVLSERQQELQAKAELVSNLQMSLVEHEFNLDQQRTAASLHIEHLTNELASVKLQLGLIEGSSAWKAVSRIRAKLHKYPKFRRFARRLARFVWWTITFQLVARLRDRRRLLQMRNLIAGSALFDASWYMSQYDGIAEFGDPVLHYALYGASERRNPGPRFDAQAYLNRYPEIANSGVNPLVHYLEHGESEGRCITAVGESAQEPAPHNYDAWVSAYDTLHETDRIAIKRHIAELRDRPLISVVMPVYNPPPQFLQKAIDSVIAQLYPNWELCIADDASTDPEIRKILESYVRRDRRIKAVFRARNGHISAASNSGLELVRGEFVVLMDHDDELTEHALYMVAVELNRHPEADIVYSDEDKIDAEGRRHEPHFKPDWNQELFYSYNMINHLGMYRTSLVREIGGFREGYEGSQDYDLVLRLLPLIQPRRIRHIPHILYHWRTGNGVQTFSTERLQEAINSAHRALGEYFESRGEKVEVTNALTPCFNRIKRNLPDPAPAASLIIPTRDKLNLLRTCIDGLLHHTRYPNLEIILVDNDSRDAKTLNYLSSLRSEPKVRVLRIEGEFNHSALNNRAVELARGSIVGFLNNDIEVIEPGWLEEMVSQVVQPGVGAVGATLYYPDNTIQHAGVILGIGGTAGHGHRFYPRGHQGYLFRLHVVQNLSCVTAACMLMPKQVFEEVGGFDELNLKASYNDVDLCIRVTQAGYSIVWTPYAELYHHEAASRGYDHEPRNVERAAREVAYLRQRWESVLVADRCYSPNLTSKDESFTFACPPRTVKPWFQPPESTSTVDETPTSPNSVEASGAKPADIWTPLWQPDYIPRSGESLDSSRVAIKTIAFYLPQFHPIPENDRWWGKNFTEWRNVAKARPRFVGHHQPRLPGDQGFYDLRVPEVLAEQTHLAKQYGISAFCFHYYWFSGRRLLEKPLNLFLADSSLDISFCICWANENWTRRWDGLENEILVAQQYSPEHDRGLIRSLLPIFQDPRYVRVHGKPLFVVYRLDLLPEPAQTVMRWRETARDAGLPDLFIAAVLSFDICDVTAKYGVDAGVEFPPHQTDQIRITGLQPIGEDALTGGAVYDYAEIARRFGKRIWTTGRVFKGVMPSWDNTPRRSVHSTVFHGSTPLIFAGWLKDACEVTKLNPDDEKLLFINAWNEWGEGAHLESDAHYGFAYLNATANVLRNYYQNPSVDRFIAENNAGFTRKSDAAIALHCYHEDVAHEIVDRYISTEPSSIDVIATVRPDISLECLQHLSQRVDNVLFLRAENRGRDIRPFLLAMREIRSRGYEFACKIHTKRSPHAADGNRWRNSLLGSLLDDGDAIATAERRFSEQQELGLLVPAGSLVDLSTTEVNAGNRVWLDKLLPRIGRADLVGSYRTLFPAGSMYWFRVAALAGLDDLLLEGDEFELEVGQLDGTLAHALERLIVLYASIGGYGVEEFDATRVAANAGR